jgi:hypothetical protein
METASGRFFDYDKPEFHIEDIAFHLAYINRYTGAAGQYSDAEHCVMVSYITKGDPFEGLMHDGHEAYIHDLNSPMKRRPGLRGYRGLERRIYRAYAQHFGLPPEISMATHEADNDAAFIEADVLLKSGGRFWPGYAEHAYLHGSYPVHRWHPEQARREFLKRYDQLTRQRSAA